jgi:hypothetical protein
MPLVVVLCQPTVLLNNIHKLKVALQLAYLQNNRVNIEGKTNLK